MRNFGYDILLATISAVIGAFCGVIIPKLLKSDEKNVNTNIDKQLIFAQIHVEQNKYIYNTSTSSVTTNSKLKKGQDVDGGAILAGGILVSLFLIYGLLRFESQISLIVLFLTVFLESMFLTTSYVVTKRCYIDRSIKGILLFNIISTIFSPVLLYLLKNPLVGEIANKSEILDTMEKEGFITILFNVNAYKFLLYQAIGIIVLLGFMLFTLMGTLHIVSMLNLALGSRMTKGWCYVYKSTLRFCTSAKGYIGFGTVLLVVCFLLVSGLLIDFMNRLQFLFA